jgi:hypothetical protein
MKYSINEQSRMGIRKKYLLQLIEFTERICWYPG